MIEERTKFTIYTEYIEAIIKETLQIVTAGFGCYNYRIVTGVWKGTEEKSLVIEIIEDDIISNRTKVFHVATAIKAFLKQDVVLVTTEKVVSILV